MQEKKADTETVQEREAAFVESYGAIEHLQERLQAVVSRKPKVLRLQEDEREKDFLVKECSTPVWVKGEVEDGRVRLRLDAGGGLVYSLAGIVCDFCDGAKAGEILSWEPAWIQKLRLQDSISYTRQNGLKGLLEKIRSFARQEG